MNSVPLTALRWAPRLASLILGGGFVLLLASEILSPQGIPPTSLREWAGIVFCATACLAPLLSWHRQFEGAALSLAALSAFAAVTRFSRYDVLLVIAMPALLFLLDWVIRRSASPHPSR
jgi:hypothetical protein